MQIPGDARGGGGGGMVNVDEINTCITSYSTRSSCRVTKSIDLLGVTTCHDIPFECLQHIHFSVR